MRNVGAIMVAVPISRKLITTTAMYFSVNSVQVDLLSSSRIWFELTV